MKVKEGDYVFLQWVDCHNPCDHDNSDYHTDQDIKDRSGLLYVYSFGRVLVSHADYITLSPHTFGGLADDYETVNTGEICIPMRSIVDAKVLDVEE